MYQEDWLLHQYEIWGLGCSNLKKDGGRTRIQINEINYDTLCTGIATKNILPWNVHENIVEKHATDAHNATEPDWRERTTNQDKIIRLTQLRNTEINLQKCKSLTHLLELEQ
jgi:hypothetical protein